LKLGFLGAALGEAPDEDLIVALAAGFADVLLTITYCFLV
jgi:hypothetical protein